MCYICACRPKVLASVCVLFRIDGVLSLCLHGDKENLTVRKRE